MFATRYGSTREYARAVAGVLGCPALEIPDGERESPGDGETGRGGDPELDHLLVSADLLVLGAPIYGPAVLPAMERFCSSRRELLAGRELAAFVVCGDTLWIPRAGEGGQRNLAKLTRLLPHPPSSAAVFGGRMRMEELDGRDRPAIEAFYRRLGKEPSGFDRMDPGAAVAWAEEIRERVVHRKGE